MAQHMNLEALGLDAGVLQLAAVDNRTPPPAVSINNILGIEEPTRELALSSPVRIMELKL